MSIGHEAVRDALEADRPRTAFVIGPDSVGKRTLVQEYLASRFETVVTFAAQDSEFAYVNSYLQAPLGALVLGETNFGDYEVAVLKHFAEHMHPESALIVVSQFLPNHAERLTEKIYRCSTLTAAEVHRVLLEKRLVPEAYSLFAAQNAGGQVKNAIATGRAESITGTVKTLLKAVHEGDQDLLTNTVMGLYDFTPVVKWWTEAKTGVWRQYSPEGSYGLHEDDELMTQVFRAIRSRSQPQLAAHAAFWSACESRAGRG